MTACADRKPGPLSGWTTRRAHPYGPHKHAIRIAWRIRGEDRDLGALLQVSGYIVAVCKVAGTGLLVLIAGSRTKSIRAGRDAIALARPAVSAEYA